MRTILLATAASFFSTAAMASPATARLIIDNDFNAGVSVHIDGHAAGIIRGDQEEVFAISTGSHLIEVRNSGKPVYREHVYIERGEAEFVRVKPKRGKVTVQNRGRYTLFIDAPGTANDLWLAAGSTGHMNMTEGAHRVEASVWTSHGLRPAQDQTMWVNAGDNRFYSLNLDPAPSTHSAHHSTRHPVRHTSNHTPVRHTVW
jgi:hypothetical protein